MAIEIERKFLVRSEEFKVLSTRVYQIEQGYIALKPTVRVRLRDQEAFLTIKGPSNDKGLSRPEWEYPIPFEEAQEMILLCGERRLIKKRYLVPHMDQVWEVDVFEGRHDGLIIAEIELDSCEATFTPPAWLGREVTADSRYYNASLTLTTELPPLK